MTIEGTKYTTGDLHGMRGPTPLESILGNEPMGLYKNT